MPDTYNRPKVVLVTGGSGGIGRAVALAFGIAGWRVAVHYNTNRESAQMIADEIIAAGTQAIAVQADITDYDAVQRMCEDVRICLGGIDTLVNNAGVADIVPFADITPDRWRRMMSTDLDGVYSCSRAALPYLSAGSSIINISSVWGLYGASCEVHYSAAKAGVIGMTSALAKELGPSGIRVNCVAPGVIATEMNAWLSAEDQAELNDCTPLGRMGTPEEVAAAVLFLASESASFITGATLPVTGGFTG
ncbi:MAG: SDR family oxidoreductase [Ruminococcaceae bacterium]|nr:SDR family oxidoreductase [Oscillospiraceae bacterium]